LWLNLLRQSTHFAEAAFEEATLAVVCSEVEGRFVTRSGLFVVAEATEHVGTCSVQ
jgi:hypothetical protein